MCIDYLQWRSFFNCFLSRSHPSDPKDPRGVLGRPKDRPCGAQGTRTPRDPGTPLSGPEWRGGPWGGVGGGVIKNDKKA